MRNMFGTLTSLYENLALENKLQLHKMLREHAAYKTEYETLLLHWIFNLET